ncbi:MAG TPA: uroporphyrinogen decarboxylase family protein [Bacillota bacterium]|nr:uroporphyrinogen decarboxylase family protein [Bacillota bacterium]
MPDITALAQERNQLFEDLLSGRIPRRVPININIPSEFAIQYAGRDLLQVQWNTPLFEEVMEKVCENFVTDTMPVRIARWPSVYRILGARNFVMGSNGIIQHPEVEGLLSEEWDAFIASPYDCLVEKILPRLYPELDRKPGQKAITLAKAFKAWSDEATTTRALYGKMTDKYGYAGLSFTSGACVAPFDYIADELRGFKGILTDVRRMPEKVLAAADVATELMIKMGTPVMINGVSSTFIPLHMAPYMREKDFEKLYWPSLKKLVEGLAAKGQPAYLFVEQDWSRFIDYLAELPENTRLRFEYGDPRVVKEKLGKKHILTGFYPLTLLTLGTKQQCIDKAKEILEIMAPGGKYFFEFDKIPLTVDSVNVENLQAVLEYVATNAKY